MVRTSTDNRAEDLVIGVLAVLALSGIDTLKTTDKAFHTGFAAALDVFNKAGDDFTPLAGQFYRDVISSTYDELDHALIAAEQLGLVRFPNPSYSRVQITITPRVAEKLLSRWKDHRDVFQRAADALYDTVYQQSG